MGLVFVNSDYNSDTRSVNCCTVNDHVVNHIVALYCSTVHISDSLSWTKA